MNVNSRGHNLDTRFKQQFSKIKHPPGPKNPVGALLTHLGPIRGGQASVFFKIGWSIKHIMF